jgi:hypothetical protein
MKRPPFAVVILLLLALSAAATALHAQGPLSAQRARHRQLVPVVQREVRLHEPCLPQFDQDRLLLTIDSEAGLAGLGTADLNWDGWTDVIVVRSTLGCPEGSAISILLNDQMGGLAEATDAVFEGPLPQMLRPSAIVLRDLNGDGRTDAFIADQGTDADPFTGGQNVLILSTPGGRLVDATANLPQQRDMTQSVAAADIDSDRDVDLYVGNLGSLVPISPQIWLNDGSGVFSVAEGRLPPEQTDWMLNEYRLSLLADVTRDGSPDLILAQNYPMMDSHVLANDGTGHFSTLATPLPPPRFISFPGIIDIDAAYLNGDGYQDLLLVVRSFGHFGPNTYSGPYIQILINRGDGTFVDETSWRITHPAERGELVSMELLDLNYDGHVDIVARQARGPRPTFYLNRGGGSFRPWEHGLDLQGFAFLDIDRDRRRDILIFARAAEGRPETYSIMRHIGCRDSRP